MGLVIKKERVADSRGRKQTQTTALTFAAPHVFEIRYDSATHHRFVLQEIRALLRPRRFDLRTTATAERWRDAILRDAPLLKEFFNEQPQLRARMLRWCDKVLERPTRSPLRPSR